METVENEVEIVESGEKNSADNEEERMDTTLYVFDSNDAIDNDDGAGCLTALVCMTGIPALLCWYFGLS